MAKILTRKKGDWTAEDPNHIMLYLLQNNFVHVDKNTGFHETSEALCDFEIHIIKKKARNCDKNDK